ncbi:hypothetical protein B7494_g5739 [Chlorociboria aeruginascens]|nr:hypothetical protein B7494_g5739 [Chlorociboria aeruginascens]
MPNVYVEQFKGIDITDDELRPAAENYGIWGRLAEKIVVKKDMLCIALPHRNMELTKFLLHTLNDSTLTETVYGILNSHACVIASFLRVFGNGCEDMDFGIPTRVGSGSFPAELLGDDDDEKTLRNVDREIGVTTGRPRRCGWLDLLVVKYSASINHYTSLNITNLDVLDGFEKIKVATKYLDGEAGEEIDGFPVDPDRLETVKFVYHEMVGFRTSYVASASLPLFGIHSGVYQCEGWYNYLAYATVNLSDVPTSAPTIDLTDG